MQNAWILTAITLLPAAGAVVVALLPRTGKVIQWFTLLVLLATLGLALHLPAHFIPDQAGFQFEVNNPWIASPNIHYHVGVDGISVWLVVLTAFLGPLAMLASWKAITTPHQGVLLPLLLQWTAMIGVFVSLDMFLYYAFWELSLVPMAIAIAMFGRDRGSAGGDQVLPLYISAFRALSGRDSLALCQDRQLRLRRRSRGSGVGQPRSHAPGALLGGAGVPGRLRGQGPGLSAAWLAGRCHQRSSHRLRHGRGRQARPVFHPALQPRTLPLPRQSEFAPWMIALAVIGLLYGALVALVQKDMKRLAAYATMSGLSFCTLGIFSFAVAGVDGRVYQILSHEISGSALLVLFGFLYERYGTYDIASYGGLAPRCRVTRPCSSSLRSRSSACQCSMVSSANSSS